MDSKLKILYKCPLCDKVFDTAKACEQHVEEHSVKDYYGTWRRVSGSVSEWFVPGGYILLNDGEYILSGVLVTKTNEDVRIRSSHFSLDAVKAMVSTDITELVDMLKETVLAKIMECRAETYAEWSAREGKA